jgi:hypothetical protein
MACPGLEANLVLMGDPENQDDQDNQAAHH